MRDGVNGKRGLRCAAAEEGWALMDAVVAATVLAIAVLAILAGLDASARSSASNRARTVAATVAEQDLERMRGLRAEQLADYHPAPRTVSVGNPPIDYEVTSSAGWVRDDSGADAACADAAGSGAYLKLSSSVQQTRGATTPPVQLTSLMAPPPGAGQLAVRVSSSTDAAVVDQSVSVTGPASDTAPVPKTDLTDDSGCALFPYLTAGTYAVAFTGPGYVDQSGSSPAQTTVNVTSATTTTATLTVDLPATVTVQVKTMDGDALNDDESTGVIAANTGIQPDGLRQFTPPRANTVITLESLFPFPSGYTIYSGGCAASDPATLVSEDYFAQHPEAVAKPAPGGTASATVLEPALNVKVTSNGSAVSGARVFVTSKTCGGTQQLSTDGSGALQAPGPGMPFGRYDICADARVRSGWSYTWRHSEKKDVANTDPDGTPLQQLELDQSGACS